MNMRKLSITLALWLTATIVSAEDRVYTLQDAYDAAMSSYEAVRISEEGVSQADSRVDQAWTYLYPRITANGAYTRYNEVLPPGGGAFIFQPEDQVQASLVLTQPLYTGGRTLAALRAAEGMQRSSRNDLTTQKQAILTNVAEAYYGVIAAQHVVESSRDSLERMERHKRVTEREAATRKSKANASALLRANSLVSQARILVVRSEDRLTVARQRLSLLTRLPQDGRFAEPAMLPAEKTSLQEMQQAALDNRRDLKSAEENSRIAKEFVTITKGAHYPQVYAEGGVRYQDSDPKTGLDATTYYGGIRVQVPIFEGGLMRYEIAEARSKVRQAEYAAELLRRSIASEVQEAFVNYRSLTAVLETAQEQYQFARDNFDTIEQLFSDGLVSSLSLIDAQQALQMAEQQLINARFEQQVAIIRLQRAQGLLGTARDNALPSSS